MNEGYQTCWALEDFRADVEELLVAPNV